MQLSSSSIWQKQIEEFRTGVRKQLPTLRGKILDRNGEVLACDQARFILSIDYSIARLVDDRFWQNYEGDDDYTDDLKKLEKIISKCAQFEGVTFEEMRDQMIRRITNPIWNIRLDQVRRRKYPDKVFEEVIPDANERLYLASKVDIAEMHQSHKLIILHNDDEVLAAQLEFIDTDGIRIEPKAVRVYPHGSNASQLIGWVHPFFTKDMESIDEKDELQRYQHGETAGFCGVEYVCESILRGRRGKVIYNIDRELIDRTETDFGQDVHLTVDIELQRKIENMLTDRNLNDLWWDKSMAAVVIDINSADVLALVSLPNFDLEDARDNYNNLLNDPNRPLTNKAIYKHYPPGSTAKPIILVAAMEQGKITPDKEISCPAHEPEKGWPRCWYQKRFNQGHDTRWAYEGGNKAINAIKGSCNIYFSRLASRLNPNVLQKWFYNFGFGRMILQSPEFQQNGNRNFRQTSGLISSKRPSAEQIKSGQFLPINTAELRYFGIGQGNFRATPLQIANAIATIARGGIYKSPELFLTETKYTDTGNTLGIAKRTLQTVRDGMSAVINEQGGTAYIQFENSGFDSKGVSVYGKTGSTEAPANALFAGFAEDSHDRGIAIVVVVEGGQHGSSDAAPLARDIISLCIEQGYIGN